MSCVHMWSDVLLFSFYWKYFAFLNILTLLTGLSCSESHPIWKNLLAVPKCFRLPSEISFSPSLTYGENTFNGFRVLTALLHGSQVVSVSQTMRRWTERATYVRQVDHHVGHWPTFLVVILFHCCVTWVPTSRIEGTCHPIYYWRYIHCKIHPSEYLTLVLFYMMKTKRNDGFRLNNASKTFGSWTSRTVW